LSVGGEVTNHVTILPLGDVIRDSAVQLGLTHQRGAIGVDSPGRIWGWFEGRGLSTSRVSPPGPLSHDSCVRVPEVVNVCVPVMVNHGVPVCACVRTVQ
jgi:hypothetical protein